MTHVVEAIGYAKFERDSREDAERLSALLHDCGYTDVRIHTKEPMDEPVSCTTWFGDDE